MARWSCYPSASSNFSSIVMSLQHEFIIEVVILHLAIGYEGIQDDVWEPCARVPLSFDWSSPFFGSTPHCVTLVVTSSYLRYSRCSWVGSARAESELASMLASRDVGAFADVHPSFKFDYLFIATTVKPGYTGFGYRTTYISLLIPLDSALIFPFAGSVLVCGREQLLL
jgi:hypothetical protein